MSTGTNRQKPLNGTSCAWSGHPVDALDTTRRLAFALGNLSAAERGPQFEDFDTAIREMVANTITRDIVAVDDPAARAHSAPDADPRLAAQDDFTSLPRG
jgi:hypothetical protein